MKKAGRDLWFVTGVLVGHLRRAAPAVLLLTFWLASQTCVHANPTGGVVTQGAATINSSGPQLTINQTSSSALINWSSFNINLGETTTFNQPSASSITWNQINDSNPSQILGNLNANGYIVLQNADGFYIGGQAAISTGGLVMTTASTPALNLSSGGAWDFDAPPPTAKIVNYGKINITGGGSAFLIADDIENNGTISAPNGKVGLYAGETVLVSTAPDGRGLSAQVTLPEGSVDNNGNLVADGGSIVAQAQIVNQNGLVQANSAQDVNGTIELLASDSVNLGANSVISAQGDSTGVSSGGTVTIKSDNAFSDQTGSTINISGGAQGGNGGQVEISAPQMNSINSDINGQAADGFINGVLSIDPYNILLASSSSDPNAQYSGTVNAGDPPASGTLTLNVNAFSSTLSQINLQAINNIELSTVWVLPNQAVPATLNLTAGNNITFDLLSGINAGQNWSVNLTAGTAFVPTTAQPVPASGSDGIYLDGDSTSLHSSYILTQNGNINLWAANEVQIGWSGTASLPGQVNLGYGSVTTVGDGNIDVTTLYGDVNSGSDPAGFDYQSTAPYFKVDPNLGGVSTAAGGNVTINAGGDVISYFPSDSEDGGSGAFGPEPGNVTITAGGNVYGHYVLVNGVGTITAGQNVGAAAGDPFALSLVSGDWNVNAPNGDIYLQEARNPNGVFNNATGGRGGSPGKHLFNYSPQAAVDLTANGVYLTGLGVPRPNGAVPILYPPILDITAGSGGVTLESDVTLFPSPYQNLDITTTDGGDFTSTADPSSPIELLMSDSAQTQWTPGAFLDSDHGSLQNEPNELDNPNPVLINISGSMENLNLITTKETDITVGGDMINCGFSGQNLQASDITSINVAGQIYNTSPYTFVDSVVIPSLPTSDLLAGMGSSWDDIFTLALNPSAIANLAVPPGLSSSQFAAYALENAGLFNVQLIGGQLTGINPGFVYNSATGQLGFAGPMGPATEAALTQSQTLTVLQLVNGVPQTYVGADGNTYFKTTTISWVAPSVITTLFTDSQGDPSLATAQLGYRIGGPGQFDVNAGSISLGNSDGILSCGVMDAAGGFNRYANLASITPSGANLNVTVAGDLQMLTSTIAAEGGGDVNVISTGGSMDLGSEGLFNSQGNSANTVVSNGHLGLGIYTTGGGNVNVTALGDVDIDGSRIATFNGGNIFVESLTGSVNVGNGGSDLNTVDDFYVNPVTGQAADYREDVFGSGIVAETLVPPLPGESLPPDATTVPGNITVETPEGDIVAGTGGILQEALDGSITAGPTINLTAGTPASGTPGQPGYSPGYVGNIDLSDSGVIGGTVNLTANGNISGLVISRQNSTVTAAQNFTGTLLSGGTANVSGGGTVAGTIIGVGGANVSGAGGITASVLAQNANVGGKSADTLGSQTTATSSTQSAAQQANSQAQQVASTGTDQDEEKKKKKKPLIQHVGRVTVILSTAIPK